MTVPNLSHWDNQLGQLNLSQWDKQIVSCSCCACPSGTNTTCPSGTRYWNRLCLSQWDKQAVCTKPVPLRLGEVKRDLSLYHDTSHIPTMESFPCAIVQDLYHDGDCTSSTCTYLYHKVRLQGRGKLCVKSTPKFIGVAGLGRRSEIKK